MAETDKIELTELMEERETALFNNGVELVVNLLSGLVGNPEWHAADGSEDYDTDLGDTLVNILAAAGLYNKDETKFASLSREAALVEREKKLTALLWRADHNIEHLFQKGTFVEAVCSLQDDIRAAVGTRQDALAG